MKHVSSEQYTVAWFTLAECIARGERERAFGVYRLLAHSLDDRALAAQLEGDLFYAFKIFDQAVEKYEQAARTYQQAGRLLEAASVYEHIRTIDSSHEMCKKKLLELYSTLQFETRVCDVAVALALSFATKTSYEAACALVNPINTLHNNGARGICYEAILFALYKKGDVPKQILHFFASQAAISYLHHHDNTRLEQYLAKIRACDDTIYNIVVNAIKKER